MVFFVAWLGWGFDVFDGLLFNYVAPNCVPTLLHLKIGTRSATQATLYWNGLLTSLLLVGWACGGVVFGRIADQIGRSRTLLMTIILYAVGTTACAIAPNMTALIIFRLIASLGIGGEWAAGAAMVAEAVPEKKRVEAGALLYTSAPAGLFLATWVNSEIAGVIMKNDPEASWRWIFLCGLIPATVAFGLLLFIREPERWKAVAADAHPKISQLFTPQLRRATLSGFLMALTALVTWWSCNAFIPVVASGLALGFAQKHHLARAATLAIIEHWKTIATYSFNWGGLIGTLLTIPAAKILGRKPMFFIYYLLSAISIFCTFGLDIPPQTRIYLYFFIGLTVFGVFGSFTYYLPELFPTRLRGTGAGFCYNIGRLLAAFGPFIVGRIASRGADSLHSALPVLFGIGFVPLAGLLFLPFVVETKGRVLEE
jgi:MFS family permease